MGSQARDDRADEGERISEKAGANKRILAMALTV